MRKYYLKYCILFITILFQFSCTSGLILLERCSKIELDLNAYKEEVQNLIQSGIDPDSLVLLISIYSPEISKFKETVIINNQDFTNNNNSLLFNVYPASYICIIMLCSAESKNSDGQIKYNLINYDYANISIDPQKRFSYSARTKLIEFSTAKLDSINSIVSTDRVTIEYSTIGIELFEKYSKGKLYLVFDSGESISKSIYANGVSSKTEYNNINTFKSWVQFNPGYFLNRKSCSFDIEITTKINKDMLQKDFYKMYGIENIYISYPKYAIGTFEL